MRTILALALLAAPAGAQTPRFAEETATAGLDATYAGDWQYMVGGGAAVFDCDADGRAEVFVAGGEGVSALFLNRSAAGGALAFERARGSGLERDAVTGAYPLDVDSDGVLDLIVLRVGENLAMRGLGGCRFERANEAWGFDGGDAWSTAMAATWERGAVWPTIAVGNYIDRREEDFPWGSCTDNWLHRPDAEGTGFAAPLPLTPSFCALSMLFTDWNRSGTPALRVSNDREYYKGGQEQMWRLAPGAPPALFGPGDGWRPLRIWGMGIAGRDLDGDGYPEYYLTSMADNKLQRLAEPGPGAKPVYADIALKRGVTAHRPAFGGDVRPSTAWHAQFADADNDGRADLFVAKGNVDRMPDFAQADPNNLLMQQADGTFVEMAEAAGIVSMETARGAALADLNLDGLLDLVVVNRRTPVQVWRNVTPDAPGSAQFLIRQPGPNPDAVGGWLELRQGDGAVQRQELTVGGGHAGGVAGWWHMGLGDGGPAEVRVIWPDGTAGDWQPLPGAGLFVLERGRPLATWTAP